MKAFSFLTILESLSKKLSILRTKMHSDNLRVDYESITSQLRVSRPFSHCASHFAAILTILFTVGVGSVWGEELIKVTLSGDKGGTQTITGTISGTAAVSGLSSSAPYKLNKDGAYVSVTLTSGNFLVGDVVTITGANKKHLVYAGTPGEGVFLGESNYSNTIATFTLPNTLPASTSTIYVYRPNSNPEGTTVGTPNGTITTLAVTRESSSSGGGETPDPDPDQPGTGGDGDCYSNLAYSGGASMPTGWTIVSNEEPKPQINNNTIAMQKGKAYAYSSGAPTRGMYFDANQNATISITSYCTNSRAFCLVEKNGDNYSIIQTWDAEETLTASIVSGRRYYLTSTAGKDDAAKCNIQVISFSDCASSDPTCTAVAAPTDLTCSARTNSSLTFGWTAASNASEYVVTLYSDANCTTQVSSQTITGTSCTFTGLSGNTTYYCKVQSKGDGTTYCTNGGTTNATSGTTLTTPTITFNNGSYTVGGSALDLSTLFESNNSNGAVTYTVTNANGTGATINGTSFTASVAGTATIKATQAANGDYCSGEATATITVNAAPVTPEPEPEDVAGEDFPNPERGFYEHAEWSWSSEGDYDDNLGTGYFTRAAEANRSLLLRIYYLDSDALRANAPLPDGFITMFTNDMDKIRSNGMKCILRFAYDKNTNEDGDEDYNDFDDASPETWATHLTQLKPYLQANADVIYVVQAGFLGVWGEWYYSKQGTGDRISEEIKNNLIDQLLDAVPANRCVQLRTPKFKRDYLDIDEPLTSAVAYKGTAQARLGHHNDAFLNGEENQGTYEYGKRTTDMAYIAQECLYVPIGGETNLEESQVAELYDKYCKGTVAEAEMAQLHYSYLNHSYSTVVTNRWKAEGSYARMSKQLGYRFELESATLPNEATAGTLMNVQLNIKNVGYAPLYNERYAYIVFKNNTNTYSIKLSSDPRTWAPNKVTTTINENVTLPVDMAAGTYDLYLHLPDASNNIANNPKYAVRFANQGIWESGTGYNKLNKQVVVTATEPTTYTITFKNGETVLQTSTIEYGATPEYTGETPTKAEDAQYTYTFSGWDPAITAVTGDATYTATFTQTAKTYSVTLNTNEGTINAGNVTSYTYGEGATLPTNVTKTGYTFGGWYESADFQGDAVTTILTTATGNKTYWAKWTEVKYTVTVNSTTNGTVTANKTTNVAQGETVTLTVTPASGYELGILTVKDASDNNVTVTDNTFIMPASNVTVSATFTAIETPEQGECEVLVNAEITAKDAARVTDGKWASDATAAASVQYDGSGTKGWKLGSNGHYFRISLTENTFKAGDIVTINIGTGGVSEQLVLYSDNGETEIGSKTENIVQGANEITLTADSKVINLYRNSTLNSLMNPWVISMSVKRCSIPVTPEPGSYTLTYDENKPAVWNDDFAVKNIPAEQTLPNGTGNVSTNTPVITEDADSDYPIYTFTGWKDGTGTSYAAGDEITITENTTLYAQWTPCTFDVKYFDTDKKTPLEGMVNTTYTFGVGIPNLPTPTKPGHTFTGWKLFYDGEGGTIIEEPVVSLANDIWGVLQLAAQWEVNCTMPTTTFANTRYTIGSGALDLRTLISSKNSENSEGEITYAVTGGVAATINGSSFTCDRIGVVTVTATQAANGGYCEKIMTATINVAMPVTDGCAQMFTFKANDAINNPDGQKGKKYLDLSSYATINGLSTTGKVGIKDMETSDDKSTTLIKNSEIHFPNTNTYLKVENLSTPLAAGDVITIDANQDNNEYIITLAGTQCKSNCITTTDQQYTILTGSSLIGVTTFYIWATTKQTHLSTINICRPAYEITYKANNGTADADVILYDAVLVAGCPNTFTVPAGKQFAGWNTDKDGTGTSYSVGTIIPVNNLELYAQWECIEPVFTVSCDKTAYAKGEVNAKPISVSVTAGNSGGVTYQWYSSTTNDRTTGTKITGATAASYTPSTTDKEGTTYYWCEISNSCTTVKTPTIAITVTVTKEDANVEWTYFDATPTQSGTIHYGGGSYMITAKVEEDWNGTLTADMLTAPDGIYVYNALALGNNTISAYFDVTTSFDRVSNPNTIPFYLSLPETDEYDPLVSIGNVPYEACTTGGESGTVILAADGTNKLKTWKNGNFSVTCNTKNGAQKTYVKPSANDTFEFSTTGGETILSVDIYHSASTSLSESTKTIITAPNTTSNLNYFKVSEANNNKIIVKATNQCYVFKTVVTYISGNGEDVSLEWDTEDDLTNQVEKEQSDPNFTYKATPSTNTLGTITYSSSNTDVATVNPNTGEVEIVATGVEDQTTTITATLAPSGCYKGATATYTISVAGMSCDISAGTLALTNGAENKCSGESVTLALTGYTADGTTIQWYKGDAIIEGATTATYTTAEPGTYSVLVTDNNNNACAKRSNTITITNISAEASVTNIVNTWYIKSGRLTPPIALWKLDEGTTFQSVQVSDGWADGTGFAQDAFFENEGIVYLTGTPPQANETGEDKTYTLTLKVKDVCGGEHTILSTITIVHQKNTDKHVLAFVVTGTEKGGFTEGITTAQTTNVPLYNEISQVFDVLATNIYATDNEQLLKEYYSRFDIICITDYPNTKEIGVNGKSYTDAMGALIDIRPIFSMEAWVSNLPNWNDKGVKGEPVSPTTRQYSMLLQCKDHEIFAGTTLITEGTGDEEMYRVTMVDATKEDYVNLDKVEENPHREKEGYKYGSNPALQGFRYESSLSSMLPIGTIEDGAGKIIQVGLERQQEEEARMMVVGVNAYAMERLTDDGETVIINTLKYLMKKSAEDISDCSIFFDNKAGDNQWNNPANWGPSYNSVPLSYQGARILEPCIVSDVVAKAAKVKIATSGTYDKGTKQANGSLTIAPNGALVVGGVISEVTAPNYYEIRPTTEEKLIVQAEVESDSQHRLGALIHDNKNGETSATIQMWNPSYWEIDQETGKKKKYWSYVAVPIQEAPIPEFFYHGFTYLYDETQGWIKKGDGTTLYPFQGIGASLQTGNKETFYGKLATTDDQDIILTKTDIAGAGQNLIGNSWTAPIQIANFEEEDFNDATATVYIYNTGRDDVYKNPTYVAGSAENDGAATAGQWIGVPIGVAGLAEYTGLKVIPAMNAFQVNTEQETELHLNYNRLVRGEGKGGVNSESNLNQPMRAPHKPIEALMRIRVAGEKTHTDMWLLQDERFDYGFDNGWEAEFVEGDDRSAQLYAVSEIGKMAFLAQPELDGTLLGFAPSRDGAEYTFSFYYTGSQKLYLNDLKLQTSTLVSDNDTYLFTYEKGDEQRFIISTVPFNIPDISTGVGNTTNGENAKAVKFIKDDKIFIFVNGTLYDATGKMVIR